MINYLIFDLDDTLCNYQAARKNAIAKVNGILQKIGKNQQGFWDKYEQIEPELFKLYTEKKLTIDGYRYRRFADALINLDYKLVEHLNDIYMNEANFNIQLFPDVVPFFEKMKIGKVKRALLTNGPSDGQRNKIKSLGLSDYLDNIYISAEIGFSKPKKEAYKYVLDDLQIEPGNAVMIGDSFENDVEVATQLGIKAILLDRNEEHFDCPIIRIRSLLDLIDDEGILKV